MAINHKNSYCKEGGYTLVETLVAMALFLSVLVPLITIMGNLMFDRGVELKSKAFMIAVSEMNEVASKKHFNERVKSAEHGLVVQRTIARSESLVEVRVSVWTGDTNKKMLIELYRTFLEY